MSEDCMQYHPSCVRSSIVLTVEVCELLVANAGGASAAANVKAAAALSVAMNLAMLT